MLGQPTSTILTGQAKIASGGTAVQLGTSNTLQNGVTVKADKSNTDPVYVGTLGVNDTGSGTGNGFALYPGDSLSLAVTNISALYINGANAGDFVYYAAN